jgi:hypothetical protein
MNFQNLVALIASIVIATAACGKLDSLQRWVWISQAKLLQQSRTSTWGSPRFFPEHSKVPAGRQNKASK